MSGSEAAHGGQSQTSDGAPDRQPVNDKVRREREIQGLLAVMRDEQLQRNEPERVFKAMRRLGDLQAVEAINDLVRLLTLKRIFDWETPETAGRTGIEETTIVPANRYPAVDALFLIGKPSLPALAKVIEQHESGSLESENAIYAVFAIFRESPKKGAAFLRRAATKASSQEARERLRTASKNKLFSV